jgi:hypothetical protein
MYSAQVSVRDSGPKRVLKNGYANRKIDLSG